MRWATKLFHWPGNKKVSQSGGLLSLRGGAPPTPATPMRRPTSPPNSRPAHPHSTSALRTAHTSLYTAQAAHCRDRTSRTAHSIHCTLPTAQTLHARHSAFSARHILNALHYAHTATSCFTHTLHASDTAQHTARIVHCHAHSTFCTLRYTLNCTLNFLCVCVCARARARARVRVRMHVRVRVCARVLFVCTLHALCNAHCTQRTHIYESMPYLSSPYLIAFAITA